jgi:hypothetical protein
MHVLQRIGERSPYVLLLPLQVALCHSWPHCILHELQAFWFVSCGAVPLYALHSGHDDVVAGGFAYVDCSLKDLHVVLGSRTS